MINLINVKINVQETQHFLWVLTNCDFSGTVDKLWRYPSSETLTGKSKTFGKSYFERKIPQSFQMKYHDAQLTKLFLFDCDWIQCSRWSMLLQHLVRAVGDHIRSNWTAAKNERVFSAQNCIQDAWTRLNKLISALPLWCKTSGISELQFSTLCYPEEKMDVEKRVTDYILWKHKGWWCFHFVDKISCGL